MAKVLVVEDEAIVQMEMLLELEKRRQFELVQAYEAAEARQALKEHVFDAACVDVMLNGEPAGLEIARELREKWRTPFIFVSGNSDKATATAASKLEPVAFLSKPVNYDALAAVLKKAIGG